MNIGDHEPLKACTFDELALDDELDAIQKSPWQNKHRSSAPILYDYDRSDMTVQKAPAIAGPGHHAVLIATEQPVAVARDEGIAGIPDRARDHAQCRQPAPGRRQSSQNFQHGVAAQPDPLTLHQQHTLVLIRGLAKPSQQCLTRFRLRGTQPVSCLTVIPQQEANPGIAETTDPVKHHHRVVNASQWRLESTWVHLGIKRCHGVHHRPSFRRLRQRLLAGWSMMREQT